MRELDGIFVGSLFDAMCKFVANTGSTDFFMIDGDVNGPSKPDPTQLFTRFLGCTIEKREKKIGRG